MSGETGVVLSMERSLLGIMDHPISTADRTTELTA